MSVPAPRLEHVLHASIDLAPPLVVGPTGQGERRIVGIVGGTFVGPRFSGVVLPGGADVQLVRQDGVVLLEARYTLRADDGALVYVLNVGIRRGPLEVLTRLAQGAPVDPAAYYFRTTPRFETASPQHAWMNDSVFVATGKRELSTVVLDIFSVA